MPGSDSAQMLPALRLDYTAADREPQHRSGILLSRVQPLERVEDGGSMLGLKTDSVISNGDDPVSPVQFRADMYSRGVILLSILYGVADQVLK